jgi:hypothetical protein
MTILATVPQAPATGPDLLARAAVLLSAVVGPGPMMGSDVHAALTQAARVRAGDDFAEAYRLADEASEMFTAWLIEIGEANPYQPASQVLRGWLLHRRLGTVSYALRAAAERWRAVLVTELAAGGGAR